jgi:hypothetical protein
MILTALAIWFAVSIAAAAAWAWLRRHGWDGIK